MPIHLYNIYIINIHIFICKYTYIKYHFGVQKNDSLFLMTFVFWSCSQSCGCEGLSPGKLSYKPSNSFRNNFDRASAIVMPDSEPGTLRSACFSCIHTRQCGEEWTLGSIVKWEHQALTYNVPFLQFQRLFRRQLDYFSANRAGVQESAEKLMPNTVSRITVPACVLHLIAAIFTLKKQDVAQRIRAI